MYFYYKNKYCTFTFVYLNLKSIFSYFFHFILKVVFYDENLNYSNEEVDENNNKPLEKNNDFDLISGENSLKVIFSFTCDCL